MVDCLLTGFIGGVTIDGSDHVLRLHADGLQGSAGRA